MALPSSGTLSLSQIKTEFGGGATFFNYHRGQAYVPNHTANSPIPTAGTISIQQFYSTERNFTCTVVNTGDFTSINGYLSPSYGSASRVGIGTSGSSTNQTQFTGIFDYYLDLGSGPIYINSQFIVSGNNTGTWWSTINLGAYTITRPDSGNYDGSYTTWYFNTGPYFGGATTTNFKVNIN